MVCCVFQSRGSKEALATLLALCLVIPAAGCGKKGGTSPPQAESDRSEEAASGTGGDGVSQGRVERGVQPGRDVSVVIVPSSPSRIAPPSVSVRTPPGLGSEIEKVTWVVNGIEQKDGNLLDPSQFQREDTIKAVVKLRTGVDELVLTTPEVKAGNALPAVSEVGIDPRAPTAGSTVRAVVDARDPDGDPLELKYEWYVDHALIPGNKETLSLNGFRRGSSVHVRVTPNDGFADGAWKYSSVYEIVNAPPVVKNEAPTTIPPSLVLTHTIVAEDPDGDMLSYTLEKGTGEMSLAGPTLTWKISKEDIGRAAEVVIRISDNHGGDTLLTMNLTPKNP